MFCGRGVISAKKGPDPLADIDRGCPSPLASCDTGRFPVL